LSFSGWVSNCRDRVVRSIHKRGIAATAWLAVLLLAKYLIQIPLQFLIRCLMWPIRLAIPLWKRCTTRSTWNPFLQILDRWYDWRFGVKTFGLVLFQGLADPDVNDYTPSPISRSAFFRILRQINVDYSQFLFVDLGCGKGKLLLLASELPFKGVIGIDVVPQMVQAAEENLKTYSRPRRCQAIQVISGNVRDFPLPEDPAIYYLYDPFQSGVVARVLDRLQRSLASAPRPIFIIYMLPEHRRLMDRCGFLTLVKQGWGYCVYRSK
jgi:SAM-dependent methyltransferase